MTARRDNDFYPTPEWMVDHLMRRLAHSLTTDFEAPVIEEPCVGAGNIVRAVETWVPDAHWQTNDIDDRFEADCYEDAASDRYWARRDEGFQRPDWVITNPPFSDAARIIPRALETAKVGVAALLRITWLEPCGDRDVFLEDHPPTWQLVMERWKFDRASKNQDSATTCWFVWLKDPRERQRIEVIRGREPTAGLFREGYPVFTCHYCGAELRPDGDCPRCDPSGRPWVASEHHEGVSTPLPPVDRSVTGAPFPGSNSRFVNLDGDVEPEDRS